MFFVTFLRRELWRRRKQAVVIALGLAVGIGLVITVTAAAAGGVRAAQGRVLQVPVRRGHRHHGHHQAGRGLPRRRGPGSRSAQAAHQVCQGSHCHQGADQARQPDQRVSPARSPAREVAIDPRACTGSPAAARGLTLSDTQIGHPRLGGHRRLAAPAARRQRRMARISPTPGSAR